jgi:3,4-dihydroxy 2-butanone 4-phosphate synthase/GTP cyclohydrolase II
MDNSLIIGVEEAIEEIKKGNMVIMIDDEDRENEGDLVLAAEYVTPEKINFMAKNARGLVCLSLTSKRCDELKLPMMVNINTSHYESPFTVSIEAREGVTTGISAYDRSQTVKVAIDPKSGPEDIARPGHVFPLRGKDGGVLVRAGHTEGSIDLARLAGLYPAAVICEIMKEDGTMAKLPDLIEFAKKYNLKIVTIADIIAYRLKYDSIIEEFAEAHLPTKFGDFDIKVFKSKVDEQQAVALTKGNIVKSSESILVRMHSQCLTGDVFGSLRCDCGGQLHKALEIIEEAKIGVLIYLFQEGRGIGILNKIRAYKLQEAGMDTVEANLHLGFGADLRNYGFGAQILKILGVKKMRLITNNPKKIKALSGFGLEIVERVPITAEVTEENRAYLLTKKNKLGHNIDVYEEE